MDHGFESEVEFWSKKQELEERYLTTLKVTEAWLELTFKDIVSLWIHSSVFLRQFIILFGYLFLIFKKGQADLTHI